MFPVDSSFAGILVRRIRVFCIEVTRLPSRLQHLVRLDPMWHRRIHEASFECGRLTMKSILPSWVCSMYAMTQGLLLFVSLFSCFADYISLVLDLMALSGPIRGLSWDIDSKRVSKQYALSARTNIRFQIWFSQCGSTAISPQIALVGERSDASSDCARVIQWDTGVTCGELGQHARGRASSVAFKPSRPLRVVTGGADDSKLILNGGPPFRRLASSDAHVKGAIYAVVYNHSGTVVASVGSDKSVCIHDGKTLELVVRKELVHDASIYACSWSSNDNYLLTCSADGTVKLLEVGDATLDIVHTWNVGSRLLEGSGSGDGKVTIGGMQLGCTFVKDDVPVSVCMNGEIVVLPRPPMLGGDVGEKEQVLTGHHAPIAALAVKDDLFYTADTDGVVVQWSAATGKAIQRLCPPNDEQGLYKIHGDATISCVTVTSDGTLLTAGWDDAIRITKNAVVSESPIGLEAQPNAMACGTELVVVMTVGGLVLLKGERCFVCIYVTCSHVRF